MQVIHVPLRKGGALPSGLCCELSLISVRGKPDKEITYYYNQFFNTAVKDICNGIDAWVFTEEQIKIIAVRCHQKGIEITATEKDGAFKLERVK